MIENKIGIHDTFIYSLCESGKAAKTLQLSRVTVLRKEGNCTCGFGMSRVTAKYLKDGIVLDWSLSIECHCHDGVLELKNMQAKT